jgi:UDP-GlcNAc:undecaprenyl-phosphate GlcNAc-1-phosphate transferase
MFSLGITSGVAFLLALLVTPVWRKLCRRLGWVDRPDGDRKLHSVPIPTAGGVAVLVAYLGAHCILILSPLSGKLLVHAGMPVTWRILPGVLLVFAIGLIDDLLGVKPWQKLAAQFIAGYAVYLAGIEITSVAGLQIPAWLGLPMTLLWLAGCSNAFNLIDGVDGLATGAALFATLTILVGALLHSNFALALATAPLAGALAGFLWYNFNPASIFLGDSGSLTLGFLLGCFGLIWGQKSTTILGMTAPLMALALPLLDTVIAIARRFLRGEPLFRADAAHIHHRLLARGFTPRKVVLLLYGACGAASVLSIVSSMAWGQFKGLVVLIFCGAAWVGIQHLGYAEFGATRRVLLGGQIRRQMEEQLALMALEERLRQAQTAEDQWQTLREAGEQFGFNYIELLWQGKLFTSGALDPSGTPCWRIEIPLGKMEYLRLEKTCGGAAPTAIEEFSELIHRHLQPERLWQVEQCGRSSNGDQRVGSILDSRVSQVTGERVKNKPES